MPAGTGHYRTALCGLFFLSGFSALIYQVCWQKQLNALLGVDTLSIALVVIVFMLGLGIGAAIGGRLADRTRRILVLFVLIEVLIALYGLGSVRLIAMSAGWGLSGRGAMLASTVFALGLPTILMGMTLPVLVIGLDRTVGNIGDASGTLYFINTVGGAAGALTTGFYLFHVMAIPQVVTMAAGGNLLVAAFGTLLIRKGNA